MILPKSAKALNCYPPDFCAYPPMMDFWKESGVSNNLYQAINPTLQYILDYGNIDSYSWQVLADQIMQLATEHANLGNIFAMDDWVSNWCENADYIEKQGPPPYYTEGNVAWGQDGTWQIYKQTADAYIATLQRAMIFAPSASA